MNKLTGIADTAGMVTSTLCLIHCLAMPVLLAMLPALSWTADERMHQVLMGVALVAALVSLGPGYLVHRGAQVPLLGGAGLACLAAAMFLVGPRYGAVAETILSMAGAVLLFSAHLRNRACCRRCIAAGAR